MCEHYVCLIEFGEESKQNEILEYLSLVWIWMTFVYWYEFDLLTIKWQTFNFIYLRTTSTRQSGCPTTHPLGFVRLSPLSCGKLLVILHFSRWSDLPGECIGNWVGTALTKFTNLSSINNSFKPNTSQFSLFMVSFNIPMPHFCFDF